MSVVEWETRLLRMYAESISAQVFKCLQSTVIMDLAKGKYFTVYCPLNHLNILRMRLTDARMLAACLLINIARSNVKSTCTMCTYILFYYQTMI